MEHRAGAQTSGINHAANAAPVLEMRNIVKRFGRVTANAGIDLHLRAGEVLALLGENGAGKSTLMNVLYGLYRADSGEILIDGGRAALHTPRAAIRAGIGMVHQHFMLIPVMTVAENIALGHEPCRNRIFVDLKRVAREITALSRKFGLEIDPWALVSDLPVGVQQRVEIIKALSHGARILILDEPTAVLTPGERDDLFHIIRGMTAAGKSIIFISHKLKEVLAVANRILVLRRGCKVGEVLPQQTSESELAELMVGRDVTLVPDRAPRPPGPPMLRIQGISWLPAKRRPLLLDVTFDVNAGEILGVAGVEGNGQSCLVSILAGLELPTAGRVLFDGVDITDWPPRRRIARGLAHIPEDRQRWGLVLDHSIRENLILNTYDRPPFCSNGILRLDVIRDHAQRLINRFDIRDAEPDGLARNLSGGNQQKIVAARELGREIRALLAVQPTRGLDVGSIEFIHRQLLEQRERGCAVLLVSTELDEIMALSDRIAVMYSGQVRAVIPREQATREQIGLLMAGGNP